MTAHQLIYVSPSLPSLLSSSQLSPFLSITLYKLNFQVNDGNEGLLLKFDQRFKIVSIYHKGKKIEEFCVNPLVYEHEVCLEA